MSSDFSVVIITSGTGFYFKECLMGWCKDFKLGTDLFVCGPKSTLEALDFNIPNNAIIDFSSQSNFSFPINAKKKVSFDIISSNYIYFIHDRFLPSSGFKNKLIAMINSFGPDFGALNIYNTDGSISLSELRLRSSVLDKSIEEFLLVPGRSSCLKVDDNASEHVAINGGQFFLHRNVCHVLDRPMHWGEMEDDLMSLDLRDFKGKWFTEPHLVTLTHRELPCKMSKNYSLNAKIKLYGLLCKLLSLMFYFSKNEVVVISEVVDKVIFYEDVGRKYFIIDPLHKRFTAEYYPSSLESFTALLRFITNGTKNFSVTKTFFGWRVF